MTDTAVCTCRWEECDETKTPQGIKSHETHCDHNPRPGVPYDQQEDLGLLDDDAGAEPTDEPIPDQSDSAEPAGGLPPASTLEPDVKSGVTAATDGGTGQHEPEECPLCGHESVTDAETAKAEYLEAVDEKDEKANGRVVLAYELADWTCDDMECAGVWGAKYNEPLTMAEVLAA